MGETVQQAEELINLDASTFQVPLGKLAETLAQKVSREVPKLRVMPDYVATDLYVLIRQARHTYDLLFYLNADERRQTDCHWRTTYCIGSLPLVRNMIDALYNITVILEDPIRNGAWFRKSGFKRMLQALEEDETRYRDNPKWRKHFESVRAGLALGLRQSNMTLTEVMSADAWPTLGSYVGRRQRGGTTTAHQNFLRVFTYGQWREYSALAHGAFEGLMKTGMYYISDSIPHDKRHVAEEVDPRVLALHIGRAALVLLCIVTELQLQFCFDDANISARIEKMWTALMPTFEGKELFDLHYSKLMKAKGIIA